MLPLLHAISCYSLLRGVLTPDRVCSVASRLGYSAVCITDRNNLYGFPVFLEACNRFDLKAIAGAEIDDGAQSALVFADGKTGFASLCSILSEYHLKKSFSLAAALGTFPDGIIVATDSPDLIVRCSKAIRVYYRMERPRRPPGWVKKEGMPSLITPVSVFEKPDEYKTHGLLRAIANHSTISRLDRADLYPEDALFQSPQQTEERFEVFTDAIASTERFARSIEPYTKPDTFLMPEQVASRSPGEVLKERAFAGALKRYEELDERSVRRIDYELGIINSKGYADYFLIVDDIVRQSPRTCGRGSGAASIVAYALGITNVDPIRYNLMFERFLNSSRTDPPDIDIDFAWDERDGVLDYVFEKYGKEHVAMVATHQMCGARMAIREVARVYGRTEHEISAVTKKIPWFADLDSYTDNLEELLAAWPGLRDANLDHPWPDILADAGRIIGLPRGIGTHCGGIVITPCPVRSVAPVQSSAKGYQILQWEKEGTEEMGLVKIDLLGNRSLAVIRDAILSIKRTSPLFDETAVDPQSDPETIRLMAQGATMGVFYVESPAMRLLQRKSRYGDFEHLVIHSSIIRPAANKYIREYLLRLHGKSYQPLHPLIGETLSETYGIMVYQEDVAKVAIALAGFSPDEADKLRKIVTKKSGGVTFSDYKSRFYTGAEKKGVKGDVIDLVWEMMCSFQGYSFCKPHSASYVQVSFQSAWLKTHHPTHFMAAVLSNYGGFYTTQAYISEAVRMGITIIPPDVNRSSIAYTATGGEIVVGLCQIKGLSSSAAETVVRERNLAGKYRSVIDLLKRTSVTEDDAEKLILAGALDTLDPATHRPLLFWEMRRYFRTGSDGEKPALTAHSPQQLLRLQYRTLGFLTEHHPITLIPARIARPAFRANRIDRSVGRQVALFGWCVTAKTVSTHTGAAMEFVTFEDETGIFETVFFPDIYNRFARLLSLQAAFLINGKITEEFGVAIIEVERLEKL